MKKSTFPELCSTSISTYSFSPHLLIHAVHSLDTDRPCQNWIPWFPSQSQHIILPYHILPLLLAFSTVGNNIKVCKASKMKRWGNHSLRGQSHRHLRVGGKVRACHGCANILPPQHCWGESPMQACSIHAILAQGSAKISVGLKGNVQPLKTQS